MKIKRYKRAQRLIGFYRNNFGYTKPYRVLVDGTFSQAALVNRINLREQMAKYLNEETELATTSCVIKELEQLGPDLYGALHICKQFDVDPCPHKPAKSASDCMASMARRMKGHGKTKYFLATQDNALTDKLRQIPGCAVLFIKFNGILIDKPSELSIETAERPKGELEVVRELKKKMLEGEEPPKKKKRKGPKGPNPLSCKKKKKEPQQFASRPQLNGNETDANDTRKRKRKSRRKPSGAPVDAKLTKIES